MAQAFTSPDGYFTTHGRSNSLFTLPEYRNIRVRAAEIADQILASYRRLGPEKLEEYLGAEVAHAAPHNQHRMMLARVFSGELIEQAHTKLASRIEADFAFNDNKLDHLPAFNFFDHWICFEGFAFKADSKRLGFINNGNVSWSAWRKVQTVYNHCKPELKQSQKVDLLLCSKCHVNLGIFAPIAIIQGAEFRSYAENSGWSGVFFKHRVNGYARRQAGSYQLINKEFFEDEQPNIYGKPKSGNQMCIELSDSYAAHPELYDVPFEEIRSEHCLAEDEASDFNIPTDQE